jgi:copper chaperone CopZ
MKSILASFLASSALIVSLQAAEVTVKISNVHLCCRSCVTGAEKAVAKVQGVTTVVDKDAGTVSLTGPDAAGLQKAADALVAAGYYGKSSDASVKIQDATSAKGQKVQSLQVSGVHLCCAKCVTSVDESIKSVAGVKSHTAEKNAKSFEVKGEFNDKDVFSALHKAGLTGTAGK